MPRKSRFGDLSNVGNLEKMGIAVVLLIFFIIVILLFNGTFSKFGANRKCSSAVAKRGQAMSGRNGFNEECIRAGPGERDKGCYVGKGGICTPR